MQTFTGAHNMASFVARLMSLNAHEIQCLYSDSQLMRQLTETQLLMETRLQDISLQNKLQLAAAQVHLQQQQQHQQQQQQQQQPTNSYYLYYPQAAQFNQQQLLATAAAAAQNQLALDLRTTPTGQLDSPQLNQHLHQNNHHHHNHQLIDHDHLAHSTNHLHHYSSSSAASSPAAPEHSVSNNISNSNSTTTTSTSQTGGSSSSSSSSSHQRRSFNPKKVKLEEYQQSQGSNEDHHHQQQHHNQQDAAVGDTNVASSRKSAGQPQQQQQQQPLQVNCQQQQQPQQQQKPQQQRTTNTHSVKKYKGEFDEPSSSEVEQRQWMLSRADNYHRRLANGCTSNLGECACVLGSQFRGGKSTSEVLNMIEQWRRLDTEKRVITKWDVQDLPKDIPLSEIKKYEELRREASNGRADFGGASKRKPLGIRGTRQFLLILYCLWGHPGRDDVMQKEGYCPHCFAKIRKANEQSTLVRVVNHFNMKHRRGANPRLSPHRDTAPVSATAAVAEAVAAEAAKAAAAAAAAAVATTTTTTGTPSEEQQSAICGEKQQVAHPSIPSTEAQNERLAGNASPPISFVQIKLTI